MRRSVFQGALGKPTNNGIAVCMICPLDPVHALRSAGHPPTRHVMIYQRRLRLTTADPRLQSCCSPDLPLSRHHRVHACGLGAGELAALPVGISWWRTWLLVRDKNRTGDGGGTHVQG